MLLRALFSWICPAAGPTAAVTEAFTGDESAAANPGPARESGDDGASVNKGVTPVAIGKDTAVAVVGVGTAGTRGEEDKNDKRRDTRANSWLGASGEAGPITDGRLVEGIILVRALLSMVGGTRDAAAYKGLSWIWVVSPELFEWSWCDCVGVDSVISLEWASMRPAGPLLSCKPSLLWYCFSRSCDQY